jgi:hypothetical protein
MTVSRPPLLAQGLACALLAGLLYLLEVLGQWPLLAGVVLVQVLLMLGVLALLDSPAAGGIFVLGSLAGAAADLAIVLDDGRVTYVPGVLGLALVAALLHQLIRRDRQRVVESLAGTMVVAALVCMTAALTAAPEPPEGPWPLRVALVAGGLTLLGGRVGDRFLPRPGIAAYATRAWPGLGLALLASLTGAALVGNGHLDLGRSLLIGLVAVSVAGGIDLALDLAATELTPAHEDARRVAALRPVAVLLPFAALAPVILLVMRLLPDS